MDDVNDRGWERLGALGGILFVVLVVIAMLLPGSPPKTSDSARKVVDFVNDNGDALRWAGYLSGLAAVPLLWWLGSIWRLMRRTEGGSPRLAVVAALGAVVSGAPAIVGAVVLGAIPIVGTDALGNDGTRAAYVAATNLAVASLFGIAVFVGAFSALMIRTGVLSRLLGWYGALVALAALVGGAAVATTDDGVFGVAFAGFLGSLVWVLVTSVLMLMAPRPATVAAPAAPDVAVAAS